MRARSEERTKLQLEWRRRRTRSEAGTESESPGRCSAALDTQAEIFEERRALRDAQTRQQCARGGAFARVRIRISTVNVTIAGRGQVVRSATSTVDRRRRRPPSVRRRPMRLGVEAGL